ncbi:MAG: hypothetical protein BGN91_13920 [Nitrobacter sp. 62-13]|uniref:AAA family ATPase n=1 Tax=Nitrobacter sp. 62-13 TaxID=1895797 RepID=UPI00095D139D|nr:AAA family ATPase [Nitrobacter sp. 62-13]OJU28076.1 MAG: hypothetical protein BGN91_13920 [Nitrobacter sp. 62-13]
MKLSRVEITHFRCFESLPIALQPDVNIIVGANGAGKSSVLDAIAIALYEIVAANGAGGKRQRTLQSATLKPTDIYIDRSAADPSVGRKPFVQVRAQAKDLYAVGEFATRPLFQDDTDSAAMLEWSQHIVFTPPNSFSYASGASEQLSQLERYFRALWQEINTSSPQALIPLPAVAYYRARRRINGMPELGGIFKSAPGRVEAYVNAMDAGASFASMCQWLYLRENEELRARASKRAAKATELPDLHAVREVLKASIAGVERVYFDGNPPRLMVDLGSSDGEPQAMELGQLSDGYRNLLALFLDFARRLVQANPTWPNPLEAPGILLIDEIELHLHPKWQQTVIPSLRSAFPNTQLVIATHSPAVLTTVRREHIHLLTSGHEFESLPADVGTYGAENSRVLAEVFGTHARPPRVETTEKLQRYLSLVEARQQGSEEARALRTELEGALGKSDPDLRRADLRVRQIEALGKK